MADIKDIEKKKEVIERLNAYKREAAQYVAKLDQEGLEEHLEKSIIAKKQVDIDFQLAAHFLSKRFNINIKTEARWIGKPTDTKGYKVKEPTEKKPRKTTVTAWDSKRGKSDLDKAIIDIAKPFVKKGMDVKEAMELATNQMKVIMGE